MNQTIRNISLKNAKWANLFVYNQKFAWFSFISRYSTKQFVLNGRKNCSFNIYATIFLQKDRKNNKNSNMNNFSTFLLKTLVAHASMLVQENESEAKLQ